MNGQLRCRTRVPVHRGQCRSYGQDPRQPEITHGLPRPDGFWWPRRAPAK